MKKSTSCSAPARRSLSISRNVVRRPVGEGGFSAPRTLTALVLCAATGFSVLTGASLAFLRSDVPTQVSNKALTFADRVAYQRAIEEVYWHHRIWPKERSDPKPSLDAVMTHAQLEKRVEDYLRNSQALEDYWQRPMTAEQLQTEMDRMAKHTKQPEVLRELFESLGNDPFVIAECLARPALAERLITNWYAYEQRFHSDLRHRADADVKAHPMVELSSIAWLKEPFQSWLAGTPKRKTKTIETPSGSYRLPTDIGNPAAGGRYNPDTDSWAPTSSVLSGRSGHTAVWTGSEMIIWGGADAGTAYDTGARYNPSTDNWTMPSTINAPSARRHHTAVWTGSEMIIWGGDDGSELNTGGRYNPNTDSWTSTSTANAPQARHYHTAVWTGTDMIVWGGLAGGNAYFDTGGRYNPSTDSWTNTGTDNAPSARAFHTAVWTGSEMIVWGGYFYDGNNEHFWSTGGRYNPSTNSWTATTTANAPDGRENHTAVWTGGEMIVWGGTDRSLLNTGGRYNPGTDSWTATSTTNTPSARSAHTAVWTGSEMIIWGGSVDSFPYYSDTGGRYNPTTDSWAASSPTNAPYGRAAHSAVWTGTEMIVWGGVFFDVYSGTEYYLGTGGRYDPKADNWVPASPPLSRSNHTAVWTGSEMIVWGGDNGDGALNTGVRYSPATDSWISTSTITAPPARSTHTAVWTGSEMIVWGGWDALGNFFNTGGNYNPSTDIWAATSTTNAPVGRGTHTAVWTGTEMLIWGGSDGMHYVNTGGRYNPDTDTWAPTSTTNAPGGRVRHSAVWTGTQMIVWGGALDGFWNTNTGGRYNPNTDSWTATTTTNAPDARWGQTEVWTGSEMIVWGGSTICPPCYSYTGGRYNPITDSWTATNTTNAPSSRYDHTAVWTGTEMIVWGGFFHDTGYINTGGRYNPDADSWTATSTTDAPAARSEHTAVWTGNEMIVWGGNTPTSPSVTPTPTPIPTPTVTPTPTPTPTPGQITLTASGRRVQGRHTVDLTWNGATSANIDIFRDGVVIATVPNNGTYKDFIGVRGGNARYIYKVCDAGTQNCSNQVTVRFGSPPL
jgi:N-acetylneuraminic acid mutarotase